MSSKNFLPLTAIGKIMIAVVILAASTSESWAAPLDDYQSCQAAIDNISETSAPPAGLLRAIGIVESGRIVPNSAKVAPWPWAVDVEGVGHLYPSKDDAIAGVIAAQAGGLTSIDVGCMQINLKYHPSAFPNLAAAFEPQNNVKYASSLLTTLFRQYSDWGAAIRAYHSSNSELGKPYGDRVLAAWHGGRPALAFIREKTFGDIGLLGQHEREVDPYHVLSPEFRAQMIEALSFRRSRNIALGLVPLGSKNSPVRGSSQVSVVTRRSASLPTVKWPGRQIALGG